EGKAKKEAPRCRLSEGACVHMAAVQERSLGCARDDETGEKYFQHNKKGYRLMSDSLFTGIFISLYKERWKRSVP
ncbi:MAG: hypothetical protein Q4F94_08260, partial [Dialister sp.]|nr:hypothetical protein [Dialister sp.]